jgi:hypothetical protein
MHPERPWRPCSCVGFAIAIGDSQTGLGSGPLTPFRGTTCSASNKSCERLSSILTGSLRIGLVKSPSRPAFVLHELR